MTQRQIPEWFDKAEMPAHLRKHLLANFTIHRDGYVVWHNGRTEFACSKTVPPDQVDETWERKRKELAGERVVKPVGLRTVREALSEFYSYLDHRVTHSQPEPMAETTRMDYEKTLTRFARMQVPPGGAKIADRRLSDIGPEDFKEFAKDFAGGSSIAFGRHVSYVQAFFRFCKDERLMSDTPEWGRYLVKPSKQTRRDERMSIQKRFSPEEIRRLLQHASVEEKAWIWLGINCAFDNSDLAHLTKAVVGELSGGAVLDYRRRKIGKIQRVCPLLPETIEAMKIYKRPAPARPEHADLFFLTPTGLPLVRAKRSKTGKPGWINYVAMEWTRLLQRAGFRPKGTTTLVCKTCGKPRPKAWGRCECGSRTFRRKQVTRAEGSADRRGFRALRTTFPNLAPHGYRDEVEIVMGHGTGILLENYLEEHGIAELRKLVEGIGHQIRSVKSLPPKDGAKKRRGVARDAVA